MTYPNRHNRTPSPGEPNASLPSPHRRDPAGHSYHFPLPPSDQLNPFRLFSDQELETHAAPAFALDGIYHEGSFIVLVGPSGGGKTFLALDLALCHATGTPWHGRAARRGPVVYVAAEGRGGLAARIGAWKEWHGWTGPAGLSTILEPTVLTESTEVERLLLSLKALPEPPVLVIVDTLARNLGHADENSARDMGQFVQGADRIRRETGAATLIIHHTGLRNGRERGSSALRGAADTTLLLRDSKSATKLHCLKQRETTPFSDLHFKFQESAHSCVLVPASPSVVTLTHNESVALEFLSQCGTPGATYTAWKDGCGLGGGAFDRAVKELTNAGRVGGGGRKGVPYVAL
jgi:hypothetical protein